MSKMDPDDLHDIEQADRLIEQAEIKANMLARIKNPAFTGRTDWLKRWNRKTNRFEVVDVHVILLNMVLRAMADSLNKLSTKLNERADNQTGPTTGGVHR